MSDQHDRLDTLLIEVRSDMLGRMLRKGTVEPGRLPLIAGAIAGCWLTVDRSDATCARWRFMCLAR